MNNVVPNTYKNNRGIQNDKLLIQTQKIKIKLYT